MNARDDAPFSVVLILDGLCAQRDSLRLPEKSTDSRQKRRLKGKSTLLSESYSGLFWCNDDDDSNEVDHAGSSTKDSADNEIKSERDLEDFARLHLNIAGPQDAIASGTIQVGLEWRNVTGTGSPSIKVYRAAEPDGGDKYLSDNNSEYYANLQMGALYKTTLGTVDSKGGFEFPASFWQATDAGLPISDADHPNRYILLKELPRARVGSPFGVYKSNNISPIKLNEKERKKAKTAKNFPCPN